MPAAIWIFRHMRHNREPGLCQQGAILVRIKACMIEWLPLQQSDSFPRRRAAREQERRARRGMVPEYGKHLALPGGRQMKETVPGNQPIEGAPQLERSHIENFGALARQIGAEKRNHILRGINPVNLMPSGHKKAGHRLP